MIYSFRKNKGKDKELERIFLEMLEANKDNFYRIAYSYVKNKDDALDVIQDSVYKGYSSLGKLKNPEYMKTWFTRIIINSSINLLKANKRFVLSEEVELKETVDHKASKSEEKIDLKRALESLKDKEKAIVVLRYFEDYKLEEIAATLDEPISTIKSTLYRALKKMKINFEEEYIYD